MRTALGRFACVRGLFSLGFTLDADRSRTVTPTRAVAVVDPEQRKKDAAALVLQRLLRGRAAQTRMYEGLQSRLPLIRVWPLIQHAYTIICQPTSLLSFIRPWHAGYV